VLADDIKMHVKMCECKRLQMSLSHCFFLTEELKARTLTPSSP